MQFRKNDIVRRKNAPFGITRYVLHVQRDAKRNEFVLLDQMLDGWQVWNADQLELVRRPPSNVERLAHLLHSRRPV